MNDRNEAPSGLRSTLPGPTAAPAAPAMQPTPGFGESQGHGGFGDSSFGGGAESSWPQRPPADRAVAHRGGHDADKKAKGFKNVLGGCGLIGVGLLFGGSVFLGNPTTLDWIFDGLGTLWIYKGVYDVATA